MSNSSLPYRRFEFHAEWLRDEPCDATTTGQNIAYRCQLSPGNREHEIRSTQCVASSAPPILHPHAAGASYSRRPPREHVAAIEPLPLGESLMNYFCSTYELACNECGKRFGNQPLSACPDCLAPLEVRYDLDSARGEFTRESIAAGPP